MVYANVQSSIVRPGTRANSLMLLVTNVAPVGERSRSDPQVIPTDGNTA